MAEVHVQILGFKKSEEASENSMELVANNANSGDICKICHCGSEESGMPLITPCLCAGSIKFVHQECLVKWMRSSNSKSCELCKHSITTDSKLRPFKQWKRGAGTGTECENLLCQICAFAGVTMLAVIILYWLVKWVTSPWHIQSLVFTIAVMLLVLIGMVMLIFLCSMCSSSIELLKKWKADNTDLAIQEVSQV